MLSRTLNQAGRFASLRQAVNPRNCSFTSSSHISPCRTHLRQPSTTALVSNLRQNLGNKRLFYTQPIKRQAFVPALAGVDEAHLSPLEKEAKKNFEKGNNAEAYGFSPDAGAVGELGLLEKYGGWTVGSLALATAISKEWLILGEETPVAIAFAAVVFAAYVNMRDGLITSVNNDYEEQIKFGEAYIEEAIAASEKALGVLKSATNLPTQARENWNAFHDLMDQYAKALNRKARIDLNQKFEAKLQDLVKNEQRFKDKKGDDLQASLGRYLRENFGKTDPKVRNAFIDEALDNLYLVNLARVSKAKKVDFSRLVSATPAIEQAAQLTGVKDTSPEELNARANKVLELMTSYDDRPEHPVVAALYKEFLSKWQQKCGNPVVRELSDQEYQQALQEADRALESELKAFDRRVAATRASLVDSPPTLLTEEQFKHHLAEWEALVQKKRQTIIANKRVPSRQVTEFRPFYSN